MKRLLTNILYLVPLGVFASGSLVYSPDSLLKVTVDADAAGRPVYSVSYKGATVVEPSVLGIRADVGDFTSGMTLTAVETEPFRALYSNPNIKRSGVDRSYNRLLTHWTNADGKKIDIEFMAADNDVAFRYVVPRQGETGAIRVLGEATSYRFPEATTTFLTPQSDAMIGWKRSKPSYEEKYSADAPMDSASQYGHGYTFPALFHTPGDGWVLLSETGVDSRYCGSHLSDYKDGAYSIAFPMPEENNGNGTVEPAFALPGATPWRTITVGDNLAPIVETTVMWDVVEPLYEASADYKPGRGTWSWIVWQDESCNYDDQIRYIDLAAAMGYEYVLVDAGWDVNIGREGMARLAEYARSKNVDLLVWYSSSGYWNDIVQSPVNIMDNPIKRKKEMQWLRSIGAKGVKVDFWGGDKQETIRLYEQVLSDADDNGLMVIFHGCTLPRGWERMYPNYVGSEAVLASENLVFQQQSCDEEAFSACLHPFIRNAAGSMEFGGTFLNKRLNRGNNGGTVRRTSDAFQLATAVLFQNPAQNFALTPNNLTDAPAAAIDFMREVPTRWDETRFIAGYPGKYVVLARRCGNRWYIAGVNAGEENVQAIVDNSQLTIDNPKLYYGDGLVRDAAFGRDGKLVLDIEPQGGAVLVGEAAPLVGGRFYPERNDDIAWENDMMGYRVYGPRTQRNGERSFGYDLFLKHPGTGLVLDELYGAQCSGANWHKVDSLRRISPDLAKEFENSFTYHIDHGKGMDCYAVGATLGCGVAALMADTAIVYPWCYKDYEIIENGPERFKVRLIFAPVAVGSDSAVVEERVITLDRGSRLNRCEVTYKGLTVPHKIVTGFPLRDGGGASCTDARKGIVAYDAPTQGRGNGRVFSGIIVPGGVEDTLVADNHVLARTTYNPGDTFVYYWGAAWDRGEISSMNKWKRYLERFRREL